MTVCVCARQKRDLPGPSTDSLFCFLLLWPCVLAGKGWLIYVRRVFKVGKEPVWMFVKNLPECEGVEVGLNVGVSPLLRQERAMTDEVVWVTHGVTAFA